jgi:hypothetical protein
MLTEIDKLSREITRLEAAADERIRARAPEIVTAADAYRFGTIAIEEERRFYDETLHLRQRRARLLAEKTEQKAQKVYVYIIRDPRPDKRDSTRITAKDKSIGGYPSHSPCSDS